MKRQWVIVFSAVLIFGLLAILNHENGLLPAAKDYLNFNRSDRQDAVTIMNDWRTIPLYKEAVQAIVWLDYLLIIVYTAAFWWLAKDRLTVVRRISKKWPAWCLRAAIYAVMLGALLDMVQDTTILVSLTSKGDAPVLKLLTWCKFRLLGAGVAVLVLAWFTKARRRVVKGMLRSMWLFFPSILFLLLVLYCFWIRDQGQDILVAFTQSDDHGSRYVFFLVVIFWVYMTWYSSRVIGYIKREEGAGRISNGLLYNYPRLAGNACLLVIELALLQAPILEHALPVTWAWGILVALLLVLHYAKDRINAGMTWAANRLGRAAGWPAIIFPLQVLVVNILHLGRTGYIYALLILLLVLHLLYLYYIQLRRDRLTDSGKGNYVKMAGAADLTEKLLAYFCIKDKEKGYVRFLAGISVAAVLVDLGAIFDSGFARNIGPFSIVLLAFAVLLSFGNLVAALSVKNGVNLHFILLVVALVFGMKETHYVRTVRVTTSDNGYGQRPTLEQYLRAWLQERLPHDTVLADTTKYDVYFVLANGGASRSGYWTASVLGRLEDTTRKYCGGDYFSKHVFCLSGTSGGGVGVATFEGLLNDSRPVNGSYEASAKNFLQQDYFTYTLARMLGPDYFNYIFHFSAHGDRAAALEQSFEQYGDTATFYDPGFGRPFASITAMEPDSPRVRLPILFVNTTRMQDGNPGLVTNLQVDTAIFGQRIDVLGLLKNDEDISLASGAILGARFPYLSPAGRIDSSYFVDGGYFDNSGAGAVQELIRGIINLGLKDTVLLKQIKRLRFHVLHIVNSPVNGADTLKPVAPIQNDLLSPISTIVGAYSMQTNVNDNRLYHFIDDIDCNFTEADHTMISLYRDTAEKSYAMNWFISDTLLNRINARLNDEFELKSLVNKYFKACVSYKK